MREKKNPNKVTNSSFKGDLKGVQQRSFLACVTFQGWKATSPLMEGKICLLIQQNLCGQFARHLHPWPRRKKRKILARRTAKITYPAWREETQWCLSKSASGRPPPRCCWGPSRAAAGGRGAEGSAARLLGAKGQGGRPERARCLHSVAWSAASSLNARPRTPGSRSRAVVTWSLNIQEKRFPRSSRLCGKSQKKKPKTKNQQPKTTPQS